MTTHALTVDVEDYFQVAGFADSVPPETWDHHESRVVESTHRVLRLFEKHQVHGTFFVLGWVARRFPALVRDIAEAGHEIGCHSHWHRLVYELTTDEFRADLAEARDTIEQITGTPVTAFRAPSFSITRHSLWALETLAEEGFTLDASIFPIRHDRYGIPGSPATPYAIETTAGTLREFPGATIQIAGQTLPVGGGGYLRLYPAALTLSLLGMIERAGRPFMIYVHPWEFDPDQPRLPARWKSRLRHYVGLKSTEKKLDRILGTFRFDAMSKALERWAADFGELKTFQPSQLFKRPKNSFPRSAWERPSDAPRREPGLSQHSQA